MFSDRISCSYNLRNWTKIRRPSQGKLFWFGSRKYTAAKLNTKIKMLEISSGVFLDPVIRSTNIQEKLSIRLLKLIVTNTDREVLHEESSDALEILVQSSLVLIQAYVAHLKIHFSLWEKFKGIPFAKSVKYFHLLIIKLVPERADLTLNTIITFFESEHLWNVEFLCCEILTSLLACNTPPVKILTQLLDYLEEKLKADNIREARHVIRVLQQILYEQFWCDEKAADCKRLIYMFYDSITEMDETNPYYKMRRGFETCVVRMCEILNNSELLVMIGIMFKLCFGTDTLLPDTINDFSHAIEIAMMFADIENIAYLADPQILNYILAAIASDSAKISRLGCRLLARLFDRHRNFPEFITPRIFLPNKYYNFKVATIFIDAKNLLLKYRTKIQYNLLLAVRQHQNATNLETVFSILCIMLIESPCSYTACQVVSILLEFQNFALDLNGNSCCTVTNQIHAMIISVLMLIAWIHRASSLAIYVQRILNRRADDAPHLNPPIKLIYQYAQHHVVWNEPCFFFDFWEIRYGLWKRFRSNEPQFPLQTKGGLMRERKLSSKSNRVHDEIVASNIVRESVDTFF